MADLIIGANTYKGVNAVRIRKADGSIGTFVDSSITSFTLRGACLGIQLGQIGINKDFGTATGIQLLPLAASATITLPTASQVGITRSFDAARITSLPIAVAAFVSIEEE